MRSVTPLKLAIVASGRSQRALAAELRMDETHLSRIVNGLHTDEDTRNRIASALHRQVDELWPPAAAA